LPIYLKLVAIDQDFLCRWDRRGANRPFPRSWPITATGMRWAAFLVGEETAEVHVHLPAAGVRPSSTPMRSTVVKIVALVVEVDHTVVANNMEEDVFHRFAALAGYRRRFW